MLQQFVEVVLLGIIIAVAMWALLNPRLVFWNIVMLLLMDLYNATFILG